MTAIVRLRWRPFRLPMRHRFEAASGTIEDRSGVLLEVVDGDGHRGVGEASPLESLGGGAVRDVLAMLESDGPALVAAMAADASAALPAVAGSAALRCAIDVALLDLEARRRDLPVAAMLTDDPAPWVAANAVIGDGPPQTVARFGMEALAAGYSVLKVKMGVGTPEEDIARIAMLRNFCPEATIRVDANCAWDEATAERMIAELYAYRIELLEQPVPAGAVEQLARIRGAASLRIAADEAVHHPEILDRVLELRAADLLVLKPMLIGGLRPAMAIAQRAADARIGAFVTTTYDSSVGIAAALHLAAALPSDAAHGLGTGAHLAADVTAFTLMPRAGRLALPPGPGLGVTYDETALNEVATDAWSERAL